MSQSHDEARPSTRLMNKTIALAVATIGHGLYLGIRYVLHGHVNKINVGIFVFLAACTFLLSVVVVLMKRTERRAREDRSFVARR